MSAARILCLAALLCTAACALTPEQQAAREAARKKQEQDLQVALAAQCDPATAELMREQFEARSYPNEQARQAFRTRYLDKVSDPMFQACYKMAWENHIAQQRLRELQRQRDWYDDWYGFRSPFYRPRYW